MSTRKLSELDRYYIKRFRQTGRPPDQDLHQILIEIEEQKRRPKLPRKQSRIVLRSYANDFCGYGYLALTLAKQWKLASVDFSFIPIDTPEPGIDLPWHDPRSRHVWELQLMAPMGYVEAGKSSVYYTMWESTRLPKECVDVLNQAVCVLVPSHWNAIAFNASGVDRPIHVVHPGVDTDLYCPPVVNSYASPGLQTGKQVCTFGTGGLPHPRKGIHFVVEAFRKAFPEGDEEVRLSIKGWPLSEPIMGDSRIELIREYWPREKMVDWYRSLTCYVSGSPGEGFGLMPLEAMACGRPVMACIAHGHEEFLTPECCIEVEYEIAHSRPRSPYNPYNGGLWFYPSIDSMATGMRQVYDGRISKQTLEGLGLVARARVGRLFSAPAFAGRVVRLLESVGAYEACGPAGKPARLSACLLARNAQASNAQADALPARALQVAVVGPTDAACGVGQYGRQLAAALDADYLFYGSGHIPERVIVQWHPFYCNRPGIAEWLASLAMRQSILFDIHEPAGLEAACPRPASRHRAIYHCRAFASEVTPLFARSDYAPLLAPDMPLGGKKICASSATIKIGWHGLWAAHKGVHLLIEAIRMKRDRGCDWGLVAVGGFHDISEDTRLKSLAYWNQCVEMAAGLEGVVGMSHSLCTYADVRATLGECDVFALPYSCLEQGQSSAAAACLSLGQPLIVTPAPLFDDIRDCVTTAAGYEAKDVANAIDSCLARSVLMCGRARERADSMRQTVAGVYRSLLQCVT